MLYIKCCRYKLGGFTGKIPIGSMHTDEDPLGLWRRKGSLASPPPLPLFFYLLIGMVDIDHPCDYSKVEEAPFPSFRLLPLSLFPYHSHCRRLPFSLVQGSGPKQSFGAFFHSLFTLVKHMEVCILLFSFVCALDVNENLRVLHGTNTAILFALFIIHKH